MQAPHLQPVNDAPKAKPAERERDLVVQLHSLEQIQGSTSLIQALVQAAIVNAGQNLTQTDERADRDAETPRLTRAQILERQDMLDVGNRAAAVKINPRQRFFDADMRLADPDSLQEQIKKALTTIFGSADGTKMPPGDLEHIFAVTVPPLAEIRDLPRIEVGKLEPLPAQSSTDYAKIVLAMESLGAKHVGLPTHVAWETFGGRATSIIHPKLLHPEEVRELPLICIPQRSRIPGLSEIARAVTEKMNEHKLRPARYE
ncbi:hypothetical protein COV82_01915 [Candidatus Peregrinibacteria bacterium CG11_big_fil_rev_8_21_14_0_20_46_8]|nr:MAG: hypothetical protein COV82_01915 [Candidatus Peregrinibacteria bacterium CG11_big_fil_rev_8_21_14_0_20_46_8]